jgi:hypothetical protein
LFANVKTNIKRVTKKNISDVKKNNISSRFKSRFEKEEKRKSLKLNKLSTSQKSRKSDNLRLKSGKNKNDFGSKLNSELTILWSRWLMSNNIDGMDAIVIITINQDGTFNYRFIRYSGNSEFDTRLKEFLDIQSIKLRPNNNYNKIYEIKTTFKIKG